MSSVCGSETLLESSITLSEGPSHVYTEQDEAGNWQYSVNGQSTYLIGIGRRRLIVPLYRELASTPEGKVRAREIFAKARDGYHPSAQTAIEPLLR